MKLYNGNRFPDFIFADKRLSTYFFEFDALFSKDFLQLFKSILIELSVDRFVIQNYDPASVVFRREFSTDELPDQVFAELIKYIDQDFDPLPANLHMITYLSEVYSLDGDESFSLILDRNYEIAILATTKPIVTTDLSEYRILDIFHYFKNYFIANFPRDIQDQISAEYSLK